MSPYRRPSATQPSVNGAPPKSSAPPFVQGVRNLNPLNFDASLLDQYAQAGGTGADILATALAGNRGDGSAVYVDPFGHDITSVIDAFNVWQGKRIENQAQYDEYLKREKAAPGRQSTILVPEKPLTPNTILGSGPTTGKTLLGGGA